MAPDKPDEPNDKDFDEDEEETTSPDHARSSVICPRCGGVGKLKSNKRCDVCRGKCRLNKKAWERWQKSKK